MKSISAPAMAAIEAGEAIVTGALEIYTPGRGPIGVPEASDVILTWMQSGDDPTGPGPSRGTMSVQYFSATGESLGSDIAPEINAPHLEWTLRTVTSSTPIGATSLQVHMHLTRVSGVDGRQGFDNISLTIGGQDIPLTNPGAEAGTGTGWTAALGNIGIGPTGSWNRSGGPATQPYEGDHFFFGLANNVFDFYQTVYLTEIIPIEPGEVEAVIRVWGGYGPIELDGQTYKGIGDRGLVQQTAGAVGGIAQGMVITVSRLEPHVLSVLDAEEIRGGAAIMRRLIFASDGKTLLDYDIWDRGRIDAVETVETIGGGAAIKINVESAARGLGRSGVRMQSDSDQRLINPNDGYMRRKSYAGEKMLYWGGKKPSRSEGSTYVGNPASGG